MASLPLLNAWKKRSLILHFSWLNLKLRFKGTALGLFWAGLEPLFIFSILYIVFTNIRDITEPDFAIYLIVGVLFYHLFSRGTSGGLISLRQNSSILKSLNIDKEIFPIISTGTICIFLFVQIGVLFGLMPVFSFVPTWTIVFLPVLFGLFLILVLGLNYLLSVLYVFFKDVQMIWNVVVYALFFVSPILWRVKDVEGILLHVQNINPIGQIIELGHKLVVFGEVPPINDWLYTAAFVFGILFLGYGLFKKYENKIAELV